MFGGRRLARLRRKNVETSKTRRIFKIEDLEEEIKKKYCPKNVADCWVIYLNGEPRAVCYYEIGPNGCVRYKSKSLPL